MDLGCIDLGCIEKKSNETFLDSESSPKESAMSASKAAKNKQVKEGAQPSGSALNKFTSQIKKPPHRKNSPLNWFPRKKVDSYLKRKIKLLQEVGGMNSTLDETLGDTNLHYSKVLKEKIAVKEAAHTAVEARKAAMVEASWCRILFAASIESKEAEALLLEAEKCAAEAFEAATSIGVVMYDIPDCPRKHYQIETSSVNEGQSTTHTVATSLETAFEVDKQVAAAVKTAFVRLASCSSINKDEFKELVRKISQNPDHSEEGNQELSEFASDCESDTGSETEPAFKKDLNCNSEVVDKKRKFSMTKLVDMMLERLKHLQEDELASLATIVATCGLNAALAEEENIKLHDFSSASALGINPRRRMSSFGSGTTRKSNVDRQQVKADALPSLDKFLVKRMTRLEREVMEAKNARNVRGKCSDKYDDDEVLLSSVDNSCEGVPDLGSILKKHSSKLEKEIEETKMKHGNCYEIKSKGGKGTDVAEVPGLDKFLVKHLSKLEREVQEAKKRREIEAIGGGTQVNDFSNKEGDDQAGKENVELNTADDKEAEDSLDKILVKPALHRLEREKLEATSLRSEYIINKRNQKKDGGNYDADCEGLDKVLVKHVSRLEKEKMMGLGGSKEEVVMKVKRRDFSQAEKSEGSLDQILVKHKSRLEKEKTGVAAAAAHDEPDNQTKHSISRREARDRELQKAWGGLSLGNSIRPHVSRLERDKAAWLKAEEEERKGRGTEEVV